MDRYFPSDSRLTRRRLLTGAARAAAAAAASALMPSNVQRLLAQDLPKNGSLREIKHVVLLMQEIAHSTTTSERLPAFADSAIRML
jgi:hypothetical protein